MAAPRIVVLGANGFIARALVHLLEAENRLFRAVSSSEVDLTDPTSVPALRSILRPGDAIIFCSGLTPEYGRDRATFFKNARMADHVAAALETASCSQVVYISSDTVTNPDGDFYALAHVVREQILHAACRDRMPLAILYPGAVFGLGDTHNAYGPNRFVRTALADRMIALFGEGEERRDHIYIRDFARIIQLCVDHRTAGKVNVIVGDAVTFREIALAVDRALGGGIAIESVPRRVPIVHRHADPAPLLAAFPEFTATPLESALADMISIASIHH
jgi:nucleoside-diphosphate-sugar epimerase